MAVWSAGAGVLVACLAAPLVLPPSYAARQAVYAWEDMPTVLPLDAELPQRTILTDDQGKTFAVFYGQNRVPLALAQVSRHVVDALLATEDDRFYEHGAVDLTGLARAVLHNGTSGSLQGASGITQQYVKNLLLTQATSVAEERAVTEQTLARKVRELRLSVALEQTLTKDQILERYLNTVNFGDGSYGIGAAARHYFGVQAADLTVAQSALLVGILKSPTNYNPVDHPDRSTTRRDVVLSRMRTTGRITDAEYAAAVASPLALRLTDPAQGCGASAYPFFCQYVLQILGSDPLFGATARGPRGPALPRRSHHPHHAEPGRDGRGAGRRGRRAHPHEPRRRRHRRRASRHRCGGRARHEPAVGPRRRADADRPARAPGVPARLELQADHPRDRAGAGLLAQHDLRHPRRLQARHDELPQGRVPQRQQPQQRGAQRLPGHGRVGEHLVRPARGALRRHPRGRHGRATRHHQPAALGTARDHAEGRIADPRRVRGVAAGDGRASTRRSPAAASPAGPS